MDVVIFAIQRDLVERFILTPSFTAIVSLRISRSSSILRFPSEFQPSNETITASQFEETTVQTRQTP